MFSYVDEFGRITNTPPEKRDEISLEDIQLGAAYRSRRKTKNRNYYFL
jgi:hypothetical protein